MANQSIKIAPNFIQHILQQGLGSEQLDNFLAYCQQPLRKSIRYNGLLLNNNSQSADSSWSNAGYATELIPWAKNSYWFNEQEKPLPAGLGNYLPHLQGQFYIQEASSMLPVTALFAACPEPKLVLDMAAAPGSKTTQIADYMDNKGLIIANELSSSRLKGLYSNVQRLGLRNVCLTHADGRIFGDKLEQCFDAILLDAPCGGEGTVRKDPQALENWSLDSVLSMAELQKNLIISAFKALKPGGTLVYSTCTLSQEENQQVCQHLLAQYPESATIYPLNQLFEGAEAAATKQGYLHIFPQIFDSEGFFVACFQKKTNDFKNQNVEQHRFPFTPVDSKSLIDFSNYCQHFAWDLNSIANNIWQRKNELWYFPDGIEKLIGKIKMDRMGVKLAESHKHGFRLQHQAAIAFGQQFSKQIYNLNDEQAVEYYKGRDLHLEQSVIQSAGLNKGELLLTYQNKPLGLAKNLLNKFKNSLPRELVRDHPFSDI